ARGESRSRADSISVAEDEEHVGERLHVVDRRRLAEEPELDRERWLVARLATLALDRLEERRLLATDIRAGTSPELDVEAPAAARDVGAEEPGLPRGLDRVLDARLRERVLAADVEIGTRGARREAFDR